MRQLYQNLKRFSSFNMMIFQRGTENVGQFKNVDVVIRIHGIVALFCFQITLLILTTNMPSFQTSVTHITSIHFK